MQILFKIYAFKRFKFEVILQMKRPILFADFRKKNNGQMSMDDGQLLEALLPSKDKEGKKMRM